MAACRVSMKRMGGVTGCIGRKLWRRRLSYRERGLENRGTQIRDFFNKEMIKLISKIGLVGMVWEGVKRGVLSEK